MFSRTNKSNYKSYEEYQGFPTQRTETSSNMINLTMDHFEPNGLLRQRSPYVFVMLQSANCGHCQMAKPEFDLLANTMYGNPNVVIATIRADQQRDLYMMLIKMLNSKGINIQGVPSYLLFKGGKVITQYTGDRSQRDMAAFLARMTSPN